MNIFQKLFLGREKRKQIASKWDYLKKFLKSTDYKDVDKIQKAEETIEAVLKIRHGKEQQSWPKKGLATMYEALKKEKDNIIQKLEILCTGKDVHGKGTGHFSDWDDELKGYFRKIKSTFEKEQVSSSKSNLSKNTINDFNKDENENNDNIENEMENKEYEQMTVEGLRVEIHKLLKEPKNNELVEKLQNLLSDKMTQENTKLPEWTDSTKITDSDFKNAGRILWDYGYDDLKFLGNGSYGVAYEDAKNKKVIKFLGDKDEIKAIGELRQNVFDKDEKAKKYLIDVKGINACICEMPLAIGDFFDEALSKKLKLVEENKENKKGGKKHIENFISHAKSLLKSLKTLHDKGYVHNDIKSENVLKLEKDPDDIQKKISNDKERKLVDDKGKKIYTKTKDGKKLKLHKRKLVLADFGTVSKISDELELCKDMEKNKKKLIYMIQTSLGYGIPCSIDTENLYNSSVEDLKCVTGDEKTIKGRDIWNAGRAIFGILSPKISKGNLYIDYLVKSNEKENIAKKLWEDTGKYIYVPEDKNSFIESTKIIWGMVRPNPKDRITVEEAYGQFKKLSSHREITNRIIKFIH